jgi:hypothetical protein
LVQALVAFLLFLDSLLHIFIPPPSVFQVASTSFGHSKYLCHNLLNACCHILPDVICIAFVLLRALFNNSFLEDL